MDFANLFRLCYAVVPVAAINAVLGTDLPAAQVREFITRICTSHFPHATPVAATHKTLGGPASVQHEAGAPFFTENLL